MKTYKQFINESLIDKMKPKSKEELKNFKDGFDEYSVMYSDERIKDEIRRKSRILNKNFHSDKHSYNWYSKRIRVLLYRTNDFYKISVFIKQRTFSTLPKRDYSKRYYLLDNALNFLKDCNLDISKIEDKNLKVYEGLIDKMKPKSNEEILKNLDADLNVTFQRLNITSSTGWLLGEVYTTFDNLVELFGYPIVIDDGFSNFNWYIKSSNGSILYIYDTYMNKKDLLEKPYNWHIGGNNINEYKNLVYYIYKNTINK